MTILNSELRDCLSPRLLHLIVLPTEACNFRCVYCYEDFRYKRMEPWVVRGVKRLLSKRAPGLDSLTLSWFGGEPLLAADIIEDIMGHARALVTGGAPSLSSSMTTNGYRLTPEMLRRTTSWGISRYQISFDGPREWHDRKRLRADGSGTFDRIWGNLLMARTLDATFRITVRVHADRENLDAIPRFLDDFAREFGEDTRFELFLRELSQLGGPRDSELRVLEPGEREHAIDRLRSDARARGLRLMGEELGVAVCYATRANSFVVRANGRLNKCTVALEHPKNQVGRIHEDGTVEIRPSPMAGWMRGLRSGTRSELACPMEGLADPGSTSTVLELKPSAAAMR